MDALFYVGVLFLFVSTPLACTYFVAMALTFRPWTRVRIVTALVLVTSCIWLLLWRGLSEAILPPLGLGTDEECTLIFPLVPLFVVTGLLILSTRSLWVGIAPIALAGLAVIGFLEPRWQTAAEESLIIPLPVIAALSVFPTLAIWTAVTRYREPFAGHPFHCRKCGYDTKGLTTARCPECGKPWMTC